MGARMAVWGGLDAEKERGALRTLNPPKSSPLGLPRASQRRASIPEISGGVIKLAGIDRGRVHWVPALGSLRAQSARVDAARRRAALLC